MSRRETKKERVEGGGQRSEEGKKWRRDGEGIRFRRREGSRDRNEGSE